MLEQRLEQDLKTALLGGDTARVTTLRNLKAALLNLKVATGKRDSGLSDDEILGVLSKQAKQRQESADLYVQGGDQARADQELSENKLIEEYLPALLSEADIASAVDDAIISTGASGLAAMGQVIGQVKGKLGAAADGAVIAHIAKEKLSQ